MKSILYTIQTHKTRQLSWIAQIHMWLVMLNTSYTYCGVPGLPCLSKSFDSYIDLNFCYPVRVSAPCLVVVRRGLAGFDGDPAPLARDNMYDTSISCKMYQSVCSIRCCQAITHTEHTTQWIKSSNSHILSFPFCSIEAGIFPVNIAEKHDFSTGSPVCTSKVVMQFTNNYPFTILIYKMTC